jgi:hypothetical protein
VPEIQSLLDLLSSDQLQSLAKRMKLDVSKKNKDVHKKNLLNVARCQRTVFGSRSSSSSSGTSNVIVKAYAHFCKVFHQVNVMLMDTILA